MEKYLRLAWRNIWRNRRRSILTISAIAFAILIVAVTRSLQYGTYDTMERLAVRLYNGEIQIQRAGFQEEQTLAYFLHQDAADWAQLVATNPELTGFSRRITGFGLVSSDSSSAGALIVGIEPGRECEITQFVTLVKEGDRLAPGDDRRVLLGVTLARNLQVGVGDTVVVLTQGYRNQMGADTYLVKGTVGMGNAELERGLLIMPLHNAQELFSLYDGITQVVVSTTDFRKANSRAKRLMTLLADQRIAVLSWEQLMPELKQLIIIDNVSGAIYLIFLLVVVGFEIFNATMMNVMERTREFAILESMGMKPKQIAGLILLESTMKITMAVLTGLAVSIVAISILIQHPIPLGKEITDAYASYGFSIEDLKFSGRLRVFLEPTISLAIIAVIALIFPVYHTIKLSPMEAFRKG